MQRRHLLQILGACSVLPFVPREAGAAVAFGRRLHLAVHSDDLEALSDAAARLVTAIAYQIIPRTDTPGASDVAVTPLVAPLLSPRSADSPPAQFPACLAGSNPRPAGRPGPAGTRRRRES